MFRDARFYHALIACDILYIVVTMPQTSCPVVGDDFTSLLHNHLADPWQLRRITAESHPPLHHITVVQSW